MKLSKKIYARIGALGLVVAVLAFFLCLLCAGEEPALISSAQDAQKAAASMLDAVCRGDFTAASALLSGNPSFGIDRQPESKAGQMVWDAFLNSLSYEIVSDCYGSGSGVAVDVRLTYMDLDSATANLQARAQAILTLRVEAAEDPSELYDENNDYHEGFAMDILYQAVTEALEQDVQLCTKNLTLNMVFEEGRWLVIPDQTLLNAVSGGILN